MHNFIMQMHIPRPYGVQMLDDRKASAEPLMIVSIYDGAICLGIYPYAALSKVGDSNFGFPYCWIYAKSPSTCEHTRTLLRWTESKVEQSQVLRSELGMAPSLRTTQVERC